MDSSVKQKIYKRRTYWFNTTYACGAVTVDQDGFVCKIDTAPIYYWMVGKKFVEVKKSLQKQNKLLGCKKLKVEVDPF